jgi:hypothetical protein
LKKKFVRLQLYDIKKELKHNRINMWFEEGERLTSEKYEGMLEWRQSWKKPMLGERESEKKWNVEEKHRLIFSIEEI